MPPANLMISARDRSTSVPAGKGKTRLITENLLDKLPEWAVFILVGLVVAAALESGFRLGRSVAARSPTDSDDGAGMVIGAVLGLLSFMLAFTFGISAAHFEARRNVILEEANAIGTAYLRTEMIEEQMGRAIADKLRAYTQFRVEAAIAIAENGNLLTAQVESDKLQREIWADVTAVAKAEPTAISGLLVSAVNEVFDVGAKRVMLGTSSMIPKSIWLSLILITIIGIASAGYIAARKSQVRRFLLIGLVLSLSTVMTLIVDLDNPRKGLLKGNQAPMEALLASMQAPSG